MRGWPSVKEKQTVRLRDRSMCKLIRRMAAERPMGIIGMVILLVLFITAVFANQLAPYEMNQIDLLHMLDGATPAHPLGTDNLGRDILSNIIRRSASILDVPCSVRAASEIASRSRGTPRIANALLRRVRDFAQVKGTGSIDTEIAQFALEALNIDKYGLDEIDNKILCTIIDKFKGGPVGITTIATALGEDAGTIEEVYEPFLIKEGFMKRTPRGREVTELAYKHLGRSLYNSQKTLFND